MQKFLPDPVPGLRRPVDARVYAIAERLHDAYLAHVAANKQSLWQRIRNKPRDDSQILMTVMAGIAVEYASRQAGNDTASPAVRDVLDQYPVVVDGPTHLQQLARAAAIYVWGASGHSRHRAFKGLKKRGIVPVNWPWDIKQYNPVSMRQDLVQAAALILTEIDRHDEVARSRPKVAA